MATDRCHCTACGERFNSTAAFDRHRVGAFRPRMLRRCLSIEEMVNRGYAQNSAGYWVTSRRMVIPTFETSQTQAKEV